LIELIAAMVLVGVAAAVVGVGFMSFTNIGSGKESAENTNLAQQRLELIFAEKISRFPTSGLTAIDPCVGPDPVTGDEFEDACDLTATFTKQGGGDCADAALYEYCSVKVRVDGRDYHMRLYNY
jgi:type II secretory pathway pseudopilin PulG